MNVLLSLLLFGLAATVCGELTARVVGGTNAPDGKYPYMVAISWGGSPDWHWCGGSILNKRFVLTAAHCIFNLSPTVIKVKYGTTVWNDTNIEWHEVEKLIRHEKSNIYNHNDKYDVGLIKLKKEIVYSEKVQPVRLPISDNIDRKFTAVATGWGRLGLGRPYSNDLQQIALNVIPHKECVKKITVPIRHQICTYTQREEGMCFGDSGSPLVAGEYQIGIGAYKSSCGVGNPSVFARVYLFLDWIEKHSRL